MKRIIIASLVGGIIIFFWQFLSNAALDLHRPAQQYTPKQDSLLSAIRSAVPEGRYFIPTLPAGASAEEQKKFNALMEGKDWALVDYHAKWNGNDMAMNMIRGLLTDIIMVYLLCMILMRGSSFTFGTTFLASIFVGLISFLNFPYTNYIWFQTPGIWQDLTDALVAWGLTGIWLGWYLNRQLGSRQ